MFKLKNISLNYQLIKTNKRNNRDFRCCKNQCGENVQVGNTIMGPSEGPSVTWFLMTSIREDNRGTVEKNKEAGDGEILE